MRNSVFLVDDSATLRAAVRQVLEEEGYEVHTANHGLEGLAFLEGEPTAARVGLIITDINMPVMDGLEFIRRVKASESRFIPIIVLSTESEKELKEMGRQAGAAGWMVKPFDPPTLIEVVKKFLR